MAIRYLQEVTEWEFPNHIYIMEGRSNIGYIPSSGEKAVIYKSASKSFSRTGRKFEEYKRKVDIEKYNGYERHYL